MTNVTLRTEVVELAKLRADALMQGKDRQVRECTHALSRKSMTQYWDGCAKGTEEVANGNEALRMFGASFDPEQVKNARLIEAWATTISCADEFTLFVLIGPLGYIGHKFIKGY